MSVKKRESRRDAKAQKKRKEQQETAERNQRHQAIRFAAGAFPQLSEPIRVALAGQAHANTRRPLPLNVLPDETDLRDQTYSPGLVAISNKVSMPDFLWPVDTLCDDCRSIGQCKRITSKAKTTTGVSALSVEFERRLLIRNQRGEGSCTGQALASVIDILRLRRQYGRPTGCYRALQASGNELADWRDSRVSARMLYQMARNYEFAPESQLSGSSVRNSLKAFFHNGACSEQKSRYIAGDLSWFLTLERARDARKIRLGSYYRVQNDVLAWQAAINEVGAMVVSAIIHTGWNKLELNPKNSVSMQPLEPAHVLAPNLIPEVKQAHEYLGGHAFAVVGYDDEGFYVLNSWGDNWGRVLDSDDIPINPGIPGVAIWRYADWSAHVFDGWVFRLAHEATSEINRRGGWKADTNPLSGLRNSSEPRLLINGHYLNLGAGGYVQRGKYPSDSQTFETTASFLQDRDECWRDGSGTEEQTPIEEPYNALALCFMHGTANIEKNSRQIEGLTSLFKAQNIYPIFVFWSYAELSHLKNIISANYKTLVERHGASDRALQLRMDRELREFGLLFYTRLKNQIQQIVEPEPGRWKKNSPLVEALKPMFGWVQKEKKPVHLLAHSDGTLLLNRALSLWMSEASDTKADLRSLIKTVSLFAPAAIENDLNEIINLNKSGTEVNFITLGVDEDERDRIGEYPGGYPRLLQNVFYPGSATRLEDRVLGLCENAKIFVHTKKGRRRRKRYHHTVAPPIRGAQMPIHFDMMNNRELMQDIIQELGDSQLKNIRS